MNFTLTDSTGAVTIVLDNSADGDGNKWVCTDHDGWDSPKYNVSTVELDVAHGGYLSPTFLPARPVSIEGVCVAPTRAASIAARQKLVQTALCFPGALGTLSAPSYITGFTTNLSVAAASGPRIKYLSAGGSFTFQLSYIAPFPIRLDTGTYSFSTLVGGSNSLTVSGNAPTPPVLTMGATGGDVTITNETAEGDPELVMTGVPANAVVDFRTHTVEAGGTQYFEVVSGVSQWWWLLPGANSITYSGPSGATLSCKTAWW